MFNRGNMIICFVLLFSVLSGKAKNPDNIYLFIYEGKAYEVVKERMTWENAAEFAVSRGGYLVEINNEAEQTAVYQAIINGAQIPTNYTSVSNGGGIAYVWIGASDQNQEGIWLWDGNNDQMGTHFWSGQGTNGGGDGSSENNAYYNWGGSSLGFPKEPDNWNNDQNYGAMALAGWPAGTNNLGTAGEWNDIMGVYQLYFVIEYNGPNGSNDILIDSPSQFSIFPNPATQTVKIDRPELIRSVEIFNIKGQCLQKTTRNEIDLTHYKNGIYLFRIKSDSHESVHKVMIMN